MKETFWKTIEESSEGLIKAGISLVVLLLAYISIRLFRRYIAATSEKHHFAPQRSNSISKLGVTLIYLVAIGILSIVLGFGIQGIFLATTSFFAMVGIAFFANWSMLSNVTASTLIYFTFPYRIGDRLSIENEPHYNGILEDVTLMYMKIRTDGGSYITVPANVAIQKIITIQSKADLAKALAKEAEEKEKA